MEDDDDFYGGEAAQELIAEDEGELVAIKDAKMESDAGEEEEEDDDDVEFTLDKPIDAKPDPAAKPSAQPRASVDRKPSVDPKPPPPNIKPSAPAVKSEAKPTPQPSSSPRPRTTSALLLHNGKEGKDFPAIRTSQLNLDTVPLWPSISDANPAGKPLTHLDIDADLATHSKPWRQPGTDQTDFFNYGFDEYTWTQYCIKQQSMAQGIADQKEQDARLKAMLEGGSMGGGGGGGGGMPSMEQFMSMMGGMGGGMDPGMMMGLMGGGGMPPGMPPQGPQGGGFQQQQGGFGGRGSQSPALGGIGGGGANVEGYSPQQLAIMQNEGNMGGGRGGRRGRGRW